MTTTIHPASVEPMVAGLMSGIDVADGPGDEQLAVLRALTRHYFARPDLDLATLPSMAPHELAYVTFTANGGTASATSALRSSAPTFNASSSGKPELNSCHCTATFCCASTFSSVPRDLRKIISVEDFW